MGICTYIPRDIQMLTRMKHAAFLLLCVDTQLPQTSLQALGISGADLYSSFQCPACLADWLACNENHYETIMLISRARRYLFSRFRIVTTHSIPAFHPLKNWYSTYFGNRRYSTAIYTTKNPFVPATGLTEVFAS